MNTTLNISYMRSNLWLGQEIIRSILRLILNKTFISITLIPQHILHNIILKLRGLSVELITSSGWVTVCMITTKPLLRRPSLSDFILYLRLGKEIERPAHFIRIFNSMVHIITQRISLKYLRIDTIANQFTYRLSQKGMGKICINPFIFQMSDQVRTDTNAAFMKTR